MLSSSLDTLLKVSKTTFPQKLFAYDCVTLYGIHINALSETNSINFNNKIEEKDIYISTYPEIEEKIFSGKNKFIFDDVDCRLYFINKYNVQYIIQ